MSIRDRTTAERLRTARAPGEAEAERRAWELMRSAYVERPTAPRSRLRIRFAVVPVVAVLVGVLALTPAGATVHRWIEQTLGVRHARDGAVLAAGPGPDSRLGSGGHVDRRLGRRQTQARSVAARDLVAARRVRGRGRRQTS